MGNPHPKTIACKIIINGFEYPLYIVPNKDYIPNDIVDNDEIRYVVQIPEGRVEIQEGAFAECKGLYAVFMPKTNTFKKIGVGAFKNCINLEIVTPA
mgnify:CR=1 FL=1